MDNLEGLRTGAQAASDNVAKFQEDIPGLLSGLKTNLTSIFAKDNPMMAEREGALQTFLNTPSQTRASLLPQNQPMVEGSPLNFSPTQQNAVVEARRNAALVPLAGLNQSIVGQYGNLGDILAAAAQTYQSQLDAAKTRAASAMDMYNKAVAQDQFAKELALKQAQERRLGAAGSGMGDFSSLITTLLGGQNQRPPLESFDLPETGGETSSQVVSNPIDFRSQSIADIPRTTGFLENLVGNLFGKRGTTLNPNLEYSTAATSGPLTGLNNLPGFNLNALNNGQLGVYQ